MYNIDMKIAQLRLQNNEMSVVQRNEDGLVVNKRGLRGRQANNIIYLETLKGLDKIKMLICVTVYSQSKNQLQGTLKAVQKNVQTLASGGFKSNQVAVVVIFDGLTKINKEQGFNKNVPNYVSNMKNSQNFKQLYQQYLQYEKIVSFKEQKEEMPKDMARDYQECAQVELTRLKHHQYKNLKVQEYQAKSTIQQLNQYIQEKINVERSLNAINHINQNVIGELNATHTQALLQLKQKLITRRVYGASLNNRIIKLKSYLDRFQPIDTANAIKLIQLKKPNFRQRFINDNKEQAKNFLESCRKQGLLCQYREIIKLDGQQFQLPTFFLFKFQNQGKLSSHNWFFNGICRYLRPTVAVLLDCGLRPAKDALIKFYDCIFSNQGTVGGVCGNMELSTQNRFDSQGKAIDNLEGLDPITDFLFTVFDIQQAQNFQYILSHIKDKAFESVTGFIHVLPGAFSAYNYEALEGDVLKEYFMSLNSMEQMDIKQRNQALAEDRTCCLQLYCKQNSRFQLRFLMDAVGQVDPIISLMKLLGQRKRWINGSYFALQNVLQQHQTKVSSSQHDCWNRLMFYMNVEMNRGLQYMMYLSIGIYFYFYYIIMQVCLQYLNDVSTKLTTNNLQIMKYAFMFFNVYLYAFVVYQSLTTNSKTINFKVFYQCSAIMGISNILILGISLVGIVIKMTDLYNNKTFGFDQSTEQGLIYVLTIAAIIIVAIYIIIPLVFSIVTFQVKTLFSLLFAAIHYVFFMPTYHVILTTYAFAKIDDFSWGTKNLDASGKQSNQQIFKEFKQKFFTKWICTNIVVGVSLITLASLPYFKIISFIVLTGITVFYMGIQFLFSLIYMLRFTSASKSNALKRKNLNERN